MTTVQITLPDAPAQEAADAGLLTPSTIERILRERLRADRIERMKVARATLVAEPLAAMTPGEISAEIDAYRSEQRRAAGGFGDAGPGSAGVTSSARRIQHRYRPA